jgi:hypothetical protein
MHALLVHEARAREYILDRTQEAYSMMLSLALQSEEEGSREVLLCNGLGL